MTKKVKKEIKENKSRFFAGYVSSPKDLKKLVNEKRKNKKTIKENK